MSFILWAVFTQRVNGKKLMRCFDSRNENKMTKKREIKCKKQKLFSYIFKSLESQKRTNSFYIFKFFKNNAMLCNLD